MEINMGKKRFRLQLLLIIYMACASTVVCKQPGYLSIDCGSDKNYIDNETGIFWETDTDYISTGKNIETLVKDPPPNQASQLPPFVNKVQAGTMRYFDDPRSRDCYVLPVRRTKNYLLRITFYYGNIGILSESPSGSFEVWVDANNWINLGWDNNTAYYYTDNYELIYSAPSSNLDVCLTRIPGPSFISSLELRELAAGMYGSAVAPPYNWWLFLNVRAKFGPSGPVKQWRYPNDAYDRIWRLKSVDSSISNPRTVSSNTSYAQIFNRPPLVVMQDACTADIIRITMPNVLENLARSDPFYIATYFQDLDGNASATNVRGMDYYVNNMYMESFNISASPSQNIQRVIPDDKYWLNVTFVQGNWSALKPSLNAMELYTIMIWDTTRTAPEDVSALHALQVRLNLLDWTGDPCVTIPFNWLSCSFETLPRITRLSLSNQGFQGNIPMEILNLTALTDLTLDSNNFSGSIPDFSSLVHLQVINLQNNNLSGEIPSFLGSVFPNLTQLNLNNNSLSGNIPSNLIKSGLDFTALNNPLITNCTVPACGYVPPAPPPLNSTLSAYPLASPPMNSSSGPGSGGESIGVVVGITLAGVVGLVIVAWIVWMLCTRKRRARLSIVRAIAQPENRSSRESHLSRKALASSMTLLTLQEVVEATKKFSKKIGEGAFGPVYYAKLFNGQEVAVKVRKTASKQGVAEFVNEVQLLSRIHHRNLVSLVGFCEEENQQILIYVYFSNGTLRDHLYGEQSRTRCLNWSTRLKIALNSAKGLEYLHTDCQPRIIHRDIKSSNILLDENMVAKVADFGISKQAPEGAFSGVETLLKGTMGYFDPEYFSSQKLTPKSDVYSFGVVLLEIISGRHPLLSQYPDGTTETLIEWVCNAVNDGRAMETVDPLLSESFKEESMMKVISLAISCVDPIRAKRPDMLQVVHILEEAIEMEFISNGNHNSANHHISATIADDGNQEQDCLNSNYVQNISSFDGAVVDTSVFLPR
ncbi:unnamed protein product [Calypogeia fissa]